MRHSLKIHLLSLSFFTIACDSPSKETDNFDRLEGTQTILEAGSSTWSTYSGIIPCADCEGIQVELKLENSDKAEKGFELSEKYLGTADGDRNFISRGIYEITYGVEQEPSAIVITLSDDRDERTMTFVQEANEDLSLLGTDGKRMVSHLNYRLIKQ